MAQFHLSHAGDAEQAFSRLRIIGRHLRQRPIREDDIRRHARFICHFLAFLTEQREQRVVVLQFFFPLSLFLDSLRLLDDAHNCFAFPEHFHPLSGKSQRAVLTFLLQISHRQKLAGNVHPLFLRQFRADAIGGEFFVPPAQNLFVLRAKQNICDVACAEFFVCAFDTGQKFLRVDGDVGQFGWGGGAVVAVGAVIGFVRFAEVVQQRFTAAGQFIFRETDDSVQVSNGNPFLIPFFLVDEIVDLGNV